MLYTSYSNGAGSHLAAALMFKNGGRRMNSMRWWAFGFLRILAFIAVMQRL